MELKKHTFLLLLSFAGAWISCSVQDDVPGPPNPKERTFFLYVAADNSLGDAKYDYANINALVGAVLPAHLLDANIVIYHDPSQTSTGRPDTRPRLLEVVNNPNGRSVTREVQTYPEQNSGSAEVFEQVLNDVIGRYPAAAYSLLMWSHGSGWLPEDFLSGDYSRAIAQDSRNGNNSWIEIDAFADAIPDGLFDCILFDACNMACAEVAYPLRGKTDYIIASTIEIMGNGMNYERIPDLLLSTQPDYKAFCDAFFETYDPTYGCTISLIDTDGLNALATSVKAILTNVNVKIIEEIPSDEWQPFGRKLGDAEYNVAFFDLSQFMEEFASESQQTAFQNAMNATVAYNRYSDGFMLRSGYRDRYGGFKITRNSGLGCYIPRDIPALNEFYTTTEWYRAVYP
jgi:hypothetical protein